MTSLANSEKRSSESDSLGRDASPRHAIEISSFVLARFKAVGCLWNHCTVGDTSHIVPHLATLTILFER